MHSQLVISGLADVDYNVFSDSYKKLSIHPKEAISLNSINEIPKYAISGSHCSIHAVNFGILMINVFLFLNKTMKQLILRVEI